MKNYHIVASTEADKYAVMETIRTAGAVVTGVSGYGSGYYIQFDATEAQVKYIDRMIYTSDIHNMNADEILTAWKHNELTMNQVLTWQQRHNVILEALPV